MDWIALCGEWRRELWRLVTTGSGGGSWFRAERTRDPRVVVVVVSFLIHPLVLLASFSFFLYFCILFLKGEMKEGIEV